ncbi:MAG TPA: DUF72 domain-containing protein [Gemmatimonadales bacterium]|nr:DUF72 domain-containing protein [Gemmatimonadales bacterium]
MHIHVGTSGWSYKEWKGSFYPQKLPAGAMLRYYADRFSAVEVNNSFYRIPVEGMLEGWAAQVRPEFRFIMKASRRITHFHRLTDRDGSLEYFLRAVQPMGSRLGPILFQLPPTLEQDLPLLASFLAKLGRRHPAAFEFRHSSWYQDEVYRLLESHNAAMVAVDEDPDEGPGAPLVVTSSWGYLRLRRNRYPLSTLRAWADRLLPLPWEESYVFFKHEEGSPTGPAPALELKAMLGRTSGDEDHDEA